MAEQTSGKNNHATENNLNHISSSDMQKYSLDRADVTNRLELALNLFGDEHGYLLEKNLHECCLNHSLACVLQREFKEFHVDCEYDQNISMPEFKKRIFFSKEELCSALSECENLNADERQSEIIRCIRPDIIIHRRGISDANLLIIETKRESNTKKNKAFDRLKLQKYTSQVAGSLGYQYGAYIEFSSVGSNHKLQMFPEII
ncbi:MAG: hypothetical protein IPO40_10530 [Fibrobacteres bacterium]|nr:hypothetical protein [Fibrobacterota bacterium]